MTFLSILFSIIVVCLSLTTAEPPPLPLPVFFFHGVTSSSMAGTNYNLNLTSEGRVFIGLNFCPGVCSLSALNQQVTAAITVIRTTIATAPDDRYARGYIFIGHSQGATIARAVIEEMDDHHVTMFISLAGAQNGIFYGPQPSDLIPLQAFVTRLGPQMLPSFPFFHYTQTDYKNGHFQVDMDTFFTNTPYLLTQTAAGNLARSPITTSYRSLNPFLPVLNNINDCSLLSDSITITHCQQEQQRRRNNFIRLTSAHFFGSPDDDVIAPWQSALLGQYTEVVNVQDFASNFGLLRVMDMKWTPEYIQDTYGLRTLDAKGGLFLYPIPHISHSCWVADSIPLGQTTTCRFQPVYDKYIYPLLHTLGWGI